MVQYWFILILNPIFSIIGVFNYEIKQAAVIWAAFYYSFALIT